MARKTQSNVNRIDSLSANAYGKVQTIVQNVNHPESRRLVDAITYRVVRRAMLRVLPRRDPGYTEHELLQAITPDLRDYRFHGAKVGWWIKTVQLDLEAKGVIARSKGRPLRLRRQ